MSKDLLFLKSSEIEALDPDRTVFFFSVGPLEDHGSHLPIGLDVLEARALCTKVAERLEKELPGWIGVIMPTVPVGIDGNSGFLSIRVRPHVLRDYLIDTCQSLKKRGFKHFVCFSGHLGPKQITAIEEAGRKIERNWKIFNLKFGSQRIPQKGSNGRVTFASASSCLVSPAQVREAPFYYYPSEHGGHLDTSVALDLGGSSWVGADLSLLETVQFHPSAFIKQLRPVEKNGLKYWGSPAKASVAEGYAQRNMIVEEVFPKLKAVWTGSPARALFKSWYSIVPFHKSFFKAWVLIFITASFLIAWMSLMLNSIDV